MYGMVEPKGVIVPLKISLAADASVSSFSGKAVQSVTKSGTGEYTIVLKDTYNKLLSSVVSTFGAISDIFPYVKSESVSSKEVVIATNDGSVDADTAVAHEIHVVIVTTKSSLA